MPVRFDPSAYYQRPPHNFSFSQSMFGEAYTYAETYYFRFCGKKWSNCAKNTLHCSAVS